MLFQLVCTDRRYSRMNCFNIREIQGNLKRRFFTDLINSHEHRELLSSSMLGLRYKLNSSQSLDLDITTFFNYGLHNTIPNKKVSYTSSTNGYPQHPATTFIPRIFSDNFIFFYIQNFNFFFKNVSSNLNSAVLILPFFFSKLASPFNRDFDIYSILNSNFLLRNIHLFLELRLIAGARDLLFINFALPKFNLDYNNGGALTSSIEKNTGISNECRLNYDAQTNFSAKNIATLSNGCLFDFSENTNSQRFNRFLNISPSYDYKTGHYLGIWEKLYPQLITSFIEVARGIRKPG